MMSLLKEFAAYGDAQSDLKTSDGSDAGAGDVSSKPLDVKFNLMRNAINTDGGVTGSDVNDYLERAHELNDEVDTVGFAIEDDDGGIIKVYVNAQQAGEFEEQMAKLLGLDDDIEAAINTLAQKFDIVDVVWPEDPADGSENTDDVTDPDADLTIDSGPDAFSLEDPAAETSPEDELPADALPADDEVEDENGEADSRASDAAPADSEAEADADADAGGDGEGGEGGEGDDTEASTDADTEGEGGEGDEASGEEEVGDEEELEPVLNDDGSQKLDKDGNPVMRKKRKEKKEPAADDAEVKEGLRDDILAHVANQLALGNKGKFYIEQLVTGGYGGPRKRVLSREGKTYFFSSREQAVQEAERLNKTKNRAGATASYKFAVKVVEHTQGESGMIGDKFLKRVLGEAAAPDTDGVKDGLNIPMDSQQRLIANRLKRPVEKKIIALFAMSGIMGRLLAAADSVEDSVMSSADMLRKNRSALNAFNDFYVRLATARGFAPQKTNEEQLVEASKLKRGSALQKKFETVLVSLGLPEDLVATDGPGALGPVLFRTTKIIDSDAGLQAALNKLALRLGISGSDVNAPLADAPVKEELIDEEVDVGNDEFFQRVVQLATALGIPERNLQFQRPNLIKGLRTKKMSLTNRGMIETRMEQLLALIAKGTRKDPQAQQQAQQQQQAGQANEEIGIFQARLILKEANLMEAFGDLEAVTGRGLEHFHVEEPEAGPVMMAAYEGNSTHEETILVVGVDPDAEGVKTLAVSIDGPWDGNMHKKYFTNDKAGYKAALEYANMLRTANLKTGGRPKGWSDKEAA